MPGCTAPYCSNSTQKGYKLYHFPSDPERCALWVKNCGREEGWTPTRHTCVCEVHFEESQFESHRADGLRKLKPFAVPTKFNHTKTDSRSRKRKKISDELQVHNEESQFESHRTDGLRKLKPFAVPTKFNHTKLDFHPRKRKRISDELQSIKAEPELGKRVTRSNRGKGNFVKSENGDIDKTEIGDFEKCGKVHIDRSDKGDFSKSDKVIFTEDISLSTSKANKCYINNNSSLKIHIKSVGPKKRKCIARSSNKKSLKSVLLKSASATEEIEESLPATEADICFICNSAQNIVQLNTCTETSKTHFNQKLAQLVAVEFDLLVEGTDGICIACATVLNCIDYVESVFCTLSKGILNLMKKKLNMEPVEEMDLRIYMKSLKNLSDTYSWREEMDGVHLSQKEDNEFVTSQLQHTKQCSKICDLENTSQSSEGLDWCTNHCSEVDSVEDRQDMGNNESYDDDNIENSEENDELEKSSTVIEFECKICSYKTHYKAVMMYHLRQHYQKLYSCDFCNIPVVLERSPDKETQASNPNCVVPEDIKKESVCESEDKPNERLSSQFLKLQTVDLKDRIILEKRGELRTGVKSRNMHKNNDIINKINKYKTVNSEGDSVAINNENMRKGESVVLKFSSSSDMVEVTLLENINGNVVKGTRKSLLSGKVGDSVSSEMLINENVNGHNNPQKASNESESIILNNGNIPKDKPVVVTFLSPMDMGEVTSLQNINGNEVKDACKYPLPGKIVRSGPSEMHFPATHNVPGNNNHSDVGDLVTYTILENCNNPSEIVPGLSVERHHEMSGVNL